MVPNGTITISQLSATSCSNIIILLHAAALHLNYYFIITRNCSWFHKGHAIIILLPPFPPPTDGLKINDSYGVICPHNFYYSKKLLRCIFLPIYFIYPCFCQNIVDMIKSFREKRKARSWIFSSDDSFWWIRFTVPSKINFLSVFLPMCFLHPDYFFVYWICPAVWPRCAMSHHSLAKMDNTLASIVASFLGRQRDAGPGIYWVFCMLVFSQYSTSLINEHHVLHIMSFCLPLLCERPWDLGEMW